MAGQDQLAFGAALLDPDLPLPAGVTGPNGKKAQRRFAVYRNNVTVGLVDALAAIFPAIQRLVGEGFFRGEPLGVGASDGEGPPPRLGAFLLGENAVLEPLAIAVERVLDPLDIAQVGAEADDHIRPNIVSARNVTARIFNTVIIHSPRTRHLVKLIARPRPIPAANMLGVVKSLK